MGESSSTESLWSYEAPGEVTEPLPASTQMFPLASTTGAAPPIQMAPWLWPAPESTAKSSAAPPASGTETTHPW